MTHSSTHQSDQSRPIDQLEFPYCDGDRPYTGEHTPLEHLETCYGGALLELDLEESDRVAVWVAGHWLVGTVTGTVFNDPEDHYPLPRGRYSVSVTLDGTHRDIHDDLPTREILLVTSTDDDYTLGPEGWKTVDVSVRRDSDSASTRTLLGVSGGVKRLPDSSLEE